MAVCVHVAELVLFSVYLPRDKKFLDSAAGFIRPMCVSVCAGGTAGAFYAISYLRSDIVNSAAALMMFYTFLRLAAMMYKNARERCIGVSGKKCEVNQVVVTRTCFFFFSWLEFRNFGPVMKNIDGAQTLSYIPRRSTTS